MSVAPYHVIVTIVKAGDEVQEAVADEIASALEKAGVEVLVDDRKERPGVKFKDADLIGIPVAITVGRGAAEGKVEYKLRSESEKAELTVTEAIEAAIAKVNAEKDGRHFFNK